MNYRFHIQKVKRPATHFIILLGRAEDSGVTSRYSDVRKTHFPHDVPEVANAFNTAGEAQAALKILKHYLKTHPLHGGPNA